LTHLRLSLVDGATALLQRITTYEELIEKLQSRYGHKGQREKMRTELRCRRRKPGETLQELSTDVERLVSLVHRQMTQDHVDVIGGIVDVASLTAVWSYPCTSSVCRRQQLYAESHGVYALLTYACIFAYF